MADKKKKRWFKKQETLSVEQEVRKRLENSNIIKKTDGNGNPRRITVTDNNGKKTTFAPGFTPNESYPYPEEGYNNNPTGWIGKLIDAHFDNDKYSGEYDLNTKERFDRKTDTLRKFNDWPTDYFQHDLQVQRLKNPLSFIGNDSARSLDGVKGRLGIAEEYSTGWEQQDPVVYGFEVIIDASSSPLLNGAIYDFFNYYENVSEIASKRKVYFDFRKQIQKLFKLRGESFMRDDAGDDKYRQNSMTLGHSELNEFAKAPSNSQRLSFGKRAYLAHYVQKIVGLHKLVERNTPTEKAYLNEYNKDFITLTFNEDVSGTLSALAHLYKLLYWSKPNGKSLIPENLLRFNCEIVVSEVRNFNRVRKLKNSNDIEVLKDNVSRHIYSLRECQFYFDKPVHDDTIDMGNIKTFEGVDVVFDYKFASVNYERWVYEPKLFGKYIGYNNGAIWKIGNNRSNRGLTTTRTFGEDASLQNSQALQKQVPEFFTVGQNSLGQSGVQKPETVAKTSLTPDIDALVYEPDKPLVTPKDERPDPIKNALRWAWKKSKVLVVRNTKRLVKPILGNLANQLNLRTNLLYNTLNKIKEFAGMNGLDTEPNNVYLDRYTPKSFGIFFDVRNQAFEFLGDQLTSTILGGLSSVLTSPYTSPNGSLIEIVNNYTELPTVVLPTGLGLSLNEILSNNSTLPLVDISSGANSGKDYSSLQFPGFAQKPALKGDATDKINQSSDNLEQIIQKESNLASTLSGPSFATKTTAFGPLTSIFEKSSLTLVDMTYNNQKFKGYDSLQFPGFAQKPALKGDVTDVISKSNASIDEILSNDSKLSGTLATFKKKSASNGSLDDIFGSSSLSLVDITYNNQKFKGYDSLQFPGFAQKPALKGDKTDVINKSSGDINDILKKSQPSVETRTKSEGSLEEILKKYSKNPSVKKP